MVKASESFTHQFKVNEGENSHHYDKTKSLLHSNNGFNLCMPLKLLIFFNPTTVFFGLIQIMVIVSIFY